MPDIQAPLNVSDFVEENRELSQIVKPGERVEAGQASQEQALFVGDQDPNDTAVL